MTAENQDDSTQDTLENTRMGDLKADFMASLVVFLVARPLCIGIAVAV